MPIEIRQYTDNHLDQITDIWNEVVDNADAFPQSNRLSKAEAEAFFSGQSFCGAAEDTDTHEILGLYILHPNNVGRCGHIANASYAVKSSARGRHIGEKLVSHSLNTGKQLGFKILQFNAVVRTNHAAIHIYQKLGFVPIGTVPNGYRLKDGTYEDILLYYHPL